MKTLNNGISHENEDELSKMNHSDDISYDVSNFQMKESSHGCVNESRLHDKTNQNIPMQSSLMKTIHMRINEDKVVSSLSSDKEIGRVTEASQ